MTTLREAAQQALEALCRCTPEQRAAITALRAALAQEEQEQEPVAWTDRELELIDGMIEVQLHHAAQCDAIANRAMAEKQKGWDMERVALLHKIKSNPPRRETEQEPGVCGRCGGLVYDPVVARQEQEPVAHTLYGKPVSVSDLSKDFTELFGFYSAPPRRETKQEPVAWMFQHEETKRMNYVSNDGCNGPGRFLVMNPRYALVCALYTTPPRRKWQGLTEEEREQATGWSVEHIEAALKEKNNG